MAKSLTNAAFGPYVLREIIGAGGIAEVYRAEHRDDGHRTDHHGYAIKVMRPERAVEKQQVKNFLEEFDTIQSLTHAAIPVVRRQGEIDGRPAFAMDLIPGDNLAVIQAKNLAYTGVRCLAELCAVTDFLHRQDIIHNDLKLENCLLRLDGSLVLVDYGSVRFPRRTSFVQRLFSPPQKSVFGTATYLAPELIQGKRPTFRTDVYALGVCAFMLLTGKPPFNESRQSGRLRANLNAAPPSLAKLLPNMHPTVSAIIDRCLAKDPEDRPMSASEVSVAAQTHLTKLRESEVVRAKKDQARVAGSQRASLDLSVEL